MLFAKCIKKLLKVFFLHACTCRADKFDDSDSFKLNIVISCWEKARKGTVEWYETVTDKRELRGEREVKLNYRMKTLTVVSVSTSVFWSC